MWSWWKRGKAHTKPDAELILAFQREVQALRLELAERERVISALKNDLERLRKGEAERKTAAVQAQMERLLTEAAGPVAQILTQTHLVETEGKPLQARDILGIARRLLCVLQDGGLKVEGRVGETVAFDPAQHEPLGAESQPAPGQQVRIRFVGVSFLGKLLRRAGIALVGG